MPNYKKVIFLTMAIISLFCGVLMMFMPKSIRESVVAKPSLDNSIPVGSQAGLGGVGGGAFSKPIATNSGKSDSPNSSLTETRWQYTQEDDRISGNPITYAVTASSNWISLAFPYEEAQRILLTIKNHPRDGIHAYISIPRGIMGCLGGCVLDVRFGNEQYESFNADRKGDEKFSSIEFLDVERFARRLKSFESLVVDVPFMGDGNHIVEFDISNFEWSQLARKPPVGKAKSD